jgi:hypothetical protein
MGISRYGQKKALLVIANAYSSSVLGLVQILMGFPYQERGLARPQRER